MLHHLLDFDYGPDGDARLRAALADGADPNSRDSDTGETPIHVAARRRRPSAVRILVQNGADIDARNRHGKTAYAHAARRLFHDVTELLIELGASLHLDPADEFAIAVSAGDLDFANAIADAHPGIARTGNPEEDRLLADVAGRGGAETAVAYLLQHGADLCASGLDSGTPLHVAAWFGQAKSAHLLLDAGAPLDVFDATHKSSPLGWAVHGSRYSGDADKRADDYAEIVRLLLNAGSSLHYAGDDSSAYLDRLRQDATPRIRELLDRFTTDNR